MPNYDGSRYHFSDNRSSFRPELACGFLCMFEGLTMPWRLFAYLFQIMTHFSLSLGSYCFCKDPLENNACGLNVRICLWYRYGGSDRSFGAKSNDFHLIGKSSPLMGLNWSDCLQKLSAPATEEQREGFLLNICRSPRSSKESGTLWSSLNDLIDKYMCRVQGLSAPRPSGRD